MPYEIISSAFLVFPYSSMCDWLIPKHIRGSFMIRWHAKCWRLRRFTAATFVIVTTFYDKRNTFFWIVMVYRAVKAFIAAIPLTDWLTDWLAGSRDNSLLIRIPYVVYHRSCNILAYMSVCYCVHPLATTIHEYVLCATIRLTYIVSFASPRPRV